MFLDGSTPTCVLRSVSGSRELAPADAPVAAGHWGSRSKAGRATRQRVHLGCWMTTPALQYLFSASDLSTSYTSDVLSLLELVKFLRMMAICTVISATSPVSSRVFTQSFHPEFSPRVFTMFSIVSPHSPSISHVFPTCQDHLQQPRAVLFHRLLPRCRYRGPQRHKQPGLGDLRVPLGQGFEPGHGNGGIYQWGRNSQEFSWDMNGIWT